MACLVGQVEKTYHTLAHHATDEEIVEAQREMMKIIAQVRDARPPFYGQALYRAIGKRLGTNDPYQAEKKEFNQKALKIVPHLETLVKSAPDGLLTAMAIAILGNTIDFGIFQNVDIDKEVAQFSLAKLGVNHYQDFVKDFTNAKKILIIGDNTGEIVFDKVLIQYLQKNYHQKTIIYAVRGGPIINDSTMEDAREVGITELCPVVETSAAPGVIWEQSSPAFQDAFSTADLIIAKGQGNFESIDGFLTPSAPIYFLLKAKCDLIAEMFHIPYGALIFYHRKK
jgi:uncharacterized protein with ATP-grasp and redox domains